MQTTHRSMPVNALMIGVCTLVCWSIATNQVASRQQDGRFVDVGGRRLFMACSGQGAPTVIIERGLAGNNLSAPVAAFTGPWAAIQSKVASSTRVCIYARANVPPSDPDPAVARAGKQVVNDLRRLLDNANIAPPYVLVGHSLGGIYARLFAARFPADVVGMVLVESSHEDQMPRLVAAGSTTEVEAPPPPERNREKADLIETINE